VAAAAAGATLLPVGAIDGRRASSSVDRQTRGFVPLQHDRLHDGVDASCQ
jgi:hypothetical protein